MNEFKIGDIVKIHREVDRVDFRFGETDTLLKWQVEGTELCITEMVPPQNATNKIIAKFGKDEYAFDPSELVLISSTSGVRNTLRAHEAAKMWAEEEKLEYFEWSSQTWLSVNPKHHYFSLGIRYRKAISTIIVNGKEIPEPMIVEPARGSSYYVPDPVHPHNPLHTHWGVIELADSIAFSNGLCHSTMQGAIEHALALHNDS